MPPILSCPVLEKPISTGMLFELVTDVQSLDPEVLEWMKDSGEIHLNPNYLFALQKADIRGFNQYIAVFKDDSGLLGFSVFQVVDMESDEPSGYLNIIPAWKLLFPKTQYSGSGIRARVLVGGDVFGTGVHLFRFRKGTTDGVVWDSLNRAALAISKREEESMDFWLIKDFRRDQHPPTAGAKAVNLTPVESEPLMILHPQKEWASFDDYLGGMKTKYRTKAKAALKRSADLVCREFGPAETKAQSNRLMELYTQLWQRASFRPGKINAGVIENWVEFMGDQCFCKAYYLEDEIVAFQLGFIQNGVLDAILVGFELELNREHSLLERMLLEFVNKGIEAGVSEIRFGRTAGELKSTVGAKAFPAYGQVRHGKAGLNRIVKWVGPRLKPAVFPIREPFKESSV